MCELFNKFICILFLIFEFLGIFFTEAVIVYYLTDGAMIGRFGFWLMILSSIIVECLIINAVVVW